MTNMTAETTSEVISLEVDSDSTDNLKIREFLKQVDRKYYHHKIENRLDEMKRFPLLGENGAMFINAFHYVNIMPKPKRFTK